jgi:hypothetical protein
LFGRHVRAIGVTSAAGWGPQTALVTRLGHVVVSSAGDGEILVRSSRMVMVLTDEEGLV